MSGGRQVNSTTPPRITTSPIKKLGMAEEIDDHPTQRGEQVGHGRDVHQRHVPRDPDGAVSKKFGVDQLPSIVILDKQGNMVDGPIGGLDPNGNLAAQLASRLDKLL